MIEVVTDSSACSCAVSSQLCETVTRENSLEKGIVKDYGYMDETVRREFSEYERRQALIRAVKRRRRRQELLLKLGIVFVCIVIAVVMGCQIVRFVRGRKTEPVKAEVPLPKKIVQTPPEYDVQLLSVNEYSRPGTPLEQVKGIVVHYTANPGTTAMQNRDYFEGLSLTGETYASSHFVIGIEGELVQCIPCSEIAYASNDRNVDTIAIECCIPDETGKFADATYNTLVHLTAWLVGRYDLDIDDVIRHYDVTGKSCPKYFVEFPLAWEELKEDIVRYIEQYGTTETETEPEGQE